MVQKLILKKKKLIAKITTSKILKALSTLHESRKNGHILTGLFYYKSEGTNLIERLNIPKSGLTQLTAEGCDLVKKIFDKILADFKWGKLT